MAIARLSASLKLLRARARAAREEVDLLSRGVDRANLDLGATAGADSRSPVAEEARRVATEVEETGIRMRRLSATMTAVLHQAEEIREAMEGAGSESGGGLFEGGKLEDYVSSQRDLIRQIEETNVGQYLDRYAELFQAMITNTDKSAGGLRAEQRALENLEVAKRIIRQFAGNAGQNFSFEAFESDLRKALEKTVREVTRTTTNAGPTSGTLGKTAADKGCSTQPLSILRFSGGLR